MKRYALNSAFALVIACQGSGAVSPDLNGTADRDGPGSSATDNTGSDTRCTGTPTGTFDNVIVPVGATCTLQGSTVRGNVKALENARLFMSNNQVEGNVEGDKASVVHVSGGSVVGDIQIKDGYSPSEVGASVIGTVVTGGDIQVEKMNTGSVIVTDARVDKGNIQVTENTTSARLEILRNTVAGDLQVFKNYGGGNKVVSGNTVRQNLQCKENASPFTGAPNSAGDREGQCA